MRFWIAAMSVAALLCSGNAALADKRVAFVVGNGAYRNVPQLPNPEIDASDHIARGGPGVLVGHMMGGLFR